MENNTESIGKSTMSDSLNHLAEAAQNKAPMSGHISLEILVSLVCYEKINLQFLDVHMPESSKGYILHIVTNILTSVQNTALV